MEHKFLNGNVIKGKQEKLISEALFDRVQQILDGNHGGYEHAAITPQFPLKGHIYYNGHMLTGYTVKKKNLDYYKYSGKDGSVNVSAKELHTKYSELLDRFNVPMELIPLLVGVLKKKFAEKENTQDDDINAVKKHLATINTYIKTAKKNFAIGKVDEDAYSSAIADLEAEKRSAEAELEKISVNLSNLASYIEDAIRIACNLSSYWNMGDFEVSQKIQKMVFPNGVRWDKENRAYLTDFGNLFFDLMFSVSENYKNEIAQKKDESCDLSSLVAGGGLEPPTSGL